MTFRKAVSLLLTTTLLFCLTLASAGADNKTKLSLTVPSTSANTVYDESYLLEVPAEFTITQAGWNSLGTIKISHDTTAGGEAFSTDKKVVVTAASQNGGLTSGTNTITYAIKSAESDTEAVTTFEFSAAEINAEGGTSKAIGVDVEDYNEKPAGEYEDYITYTAEVETAVLRVGSTYTFGTYNGADLTWRVLSIDETDNRALLITERVLLNSAYHTTSLEAIAWADCSLRSWLNGDFLNNFSSAEQSKIAQVTLTNNIGGNTDDKMFLMCSSATRRGTAAPSG